MNAKLTYLFLGAAMLASCSGNSKKEESPATAPTPTQSTVPNPSDNKAANVEILSMNNIVFEISTNGDILTIQPQGLSVDNQKVTKDIKGYSVESAEIGDLNGDNYPDLFVYLESDTDEDYGKVIGYSVNNGKSMSEIYMPELSDNQEASKGYMGHDRFAIVDSSLVRTFPICEGIEKKDSGKNRKIIYRLEEGEASRQLAIRAIEED